MDKYSVLQDTEKKTKVMDSTFGVDNLSALAFLNASEKLVKLSSESL